MAKARVGYLGPEGSFTHEAVTTLSDVEAIPYPTIEDLLAAVADQSLDQGLVPLENAIEEMCIRDRIGLLAIFYVRLIGWVSFHRAKGAHLLWAMPAAFAVVGVVGLWLSLIHI